MPISTVSRWTMAYFALALFAFLLAQLMMAAGWAYPALPAEAPETLIAVHLMSIGWLSILVLGALYQFVPVIVARPPSGDRLALASLLLIESGLALLLAGFAALGGLVAVPVGLLPLGGTLVLAGFAVGVANFAPLLWRARPLPLSGRFVAGGLVFLLVAGLLGAGFALALAGSAVPDWLSPLRLGLALHVVAGLGGWLTLTALGVSYRLLAMFMLAPEREHGLCVLALRAALAGLVLWWGATLAASWFGSAARTAAGIGAAIALCGLLLYAFDMASLFGARRRRRLELNSAAAAASIISLVIAVAALALLAAAGRVARFSGPLLYLVAFGWLSGLGLGQLYKIVPFLTWLERYGPLLGKTPVPRVQDLVDEPRAAPWFALYFAAVLLGAACGFLGWNGAWRAAIALHLVATVAIAVELWRARHPRLALGGGAPRTSLVKGDA